MNDPRFKKKKCISRADGEVIWEKIEGEFATKMQEKVNVQT